MFTRRHFIGAAAATLAAPAVYTSQAFGQAWPSRNVRIIVPFAPAGATDITARLLANRLQEVWGQPVVVENKPGAGGNVGADLAAKSDPDGYTIFIVGPGQATNKFLYPSLTYDPVNDFQPVSLLLTQPNMMCVPNSSPAKSVQEFIDYCKKNPDKVTYASSGNGTTLHLSGELFKKLAGVQMTHVPYRGSGPLMNDLIPGRVDVVFDNAPSISPHVKGGAVRGLAVTTLKRVAIAPELPTIDESGVKGFDVSSWFAFFLPVKTPKEIATKLHADTVAALRHDAVRARLLELGADPVGSTPDELAKHLKAEMDKWGPVIAEARIRIEN
jgi:tripartite-type tricarboxylate transporter receptor subunit TctC